MDSGKIQKSLEVSWKEGIPASVMLGILEYYLVPYALFLGATTPQIGFLVAVPYLLASVAQLFAVRAVRLTGSRRLLLVRASLLQAVLLVPVAFLVWGPVRRRIQNLILLTIAFRALNSLIATVWGSLVSDYLPAGKRGNYFGWRSQVTAIASVAGMGFAGLTLFLLKDRFPTLGFFILFVAASICRFVSAILLSRMADLPLALGPESDVSFLAFERLKEDNVAKFILYFSGMLFVTFLAAPYFSVFMLRDLRFDYLRYMCVHLASVIAGFLSYPRWGRHADLLGNAKILRATGVLIPFVPILWLVSHHPLYLVAVEAFSGFVWGGFMLCATNFVYDAVGPEKRVKGLSIFSLMNGVAIFAGASLGGLLVGRLPSVWGFPLLTLFALSGVLRLLIHVFLSRRFCEVREGVRPVSFFRLLFSVIGFRPLSGLSRDWTVVPPAKLFSRSNERLAD